MPGEPAVKPPTKKIKKRRSFLQRLFFWCFVLTVLGFIASGTASWWAYKNRVSIANRYLADLDPFTATIGGLEASTGGHLTATDFILKEKATGAEVLHLPKVEAQLEWKNAMSKRVSEIILTDIHLALHEEQLKPWMQKLAQARNTQPAQPVDSAAIPFHLDKLSVKNARVRFTQTTGATAEITVNYTARDLVQGSNGQLTSGEQELIIEGGRFRRTQEDENAPFAIERLETKGRIENQTLVLDYLHINQPSLHLTPSLLTTFGMDFGRPSESKAKADINDPNVAATDEQKLEPVATGLALQIKQFNLTAFDFSALGFDGNSETNHTGLTLPNVSGLLSLETQDVLYKDGQFTSAPQEWHLKEWKIETVDDEGHIRLPLLNLTMAAVEKGQPIKVQSLYLSKPDIRWTSALKESWQPPDQEKDKEATAPTAKLESAALPTSENPASNTSVDWQVQFQKAELLDGQLLLADEALVPFHISTGVTIKLDDLSISNQGWQSDKVQSLQVKNGQMEFPAGAGEQEKKPFFDLVSGRLEIIPDEWNKRHHVTNLTLEKPLVRIRDKNTPWDSTSETPVVTTDTTPQKEIPVEVPVGTQPAETEAPWWQQLTFDELRLNEGSVDLLINAPKSVDAKALLSIVTESSDKGGKIHRLKVEDLETRLPTLSRLPFPIASANAFEATVRLPELWTKRHLDSLSLQGASLEAGDTLMEFMQPEEGAAPIPSADPQEQDTSKQTAPTNSKPPWSVGQLDIKESSITVVNLVPGLPAIKFNIQYHSENMPLDAEGLEKNAIPQRLELANLTIPSPYEPLRPVAELSSVFIHFTLNGLMNKRVDKVEIITPTLYVGEDLFWYVDYYRKYVTNGKTAVDGPQVASTGNEEQMLQAAVNVLDKEPAPAEAAWSIKQLQVSGGKLVLAPKGKPLKGFGQPFPFDINTEVIRGTLEAELQIPPDTYTLDEYKLQFEGMSGHVVFNLPIKQRDNNLIETFEVDRIRWKELQTGKAYMTITYDSAGIYAHFGAEAYEGYVNGEFNIYLDEVYSWDGWISGKNVQTNELTQKLMPGYFFMKGKVEGQVVAQGNKTELYQADGSFKNHTPGEFSILALNDTIKDLPADWNAFESSLTQLGMETMRDFNYDTADAKFRFYGREGNGIVRFIGPTGSRNFDINVYDHRWTTDKVGVTKNE